MNVDLGCVVCDAHPEAPLRPAKVTFALGIEMRALRCSHPGCNRHYQPRHGYFPLIDNQGIDFGDDQPKPRCENGHARTCLLVAEINGVVQWACPEPGCATTMFYSPPLKQ